MPKGKSDASGHGPVYESSGSIADLLRSAANPHRIRILALASGGGTGFSQMAEATSLSKTALANHLSHLVDKGLVARRARGTYELTQDGRDLLAAAYSTFRRSARRAEEEKDLIRRSYGAAYGQIEAPRGQVISGDARYESCWLSILGAVSGSLKALGTKASVIDVGGFTGRSFLVNVSRGETCPSGPTALHIRTFHEMLHGIECLGWRVQSREHPRSYPSTPGSPSPEDLRVAREVFGRVKRQIDRQDRPVVLYGLAAPEYGIVRGYEGESYIVSTFRGLQNPGEEEEPVPFHKLNAPGCIDEIYFADRVKIRPSKARREALARALRFAEGEAETARNYVSGPPAFEEWAGVLEDVPEGSQNYMGNSYVAACVQEGRAISSAFLKRLAKEPPVSQSRHLSRASLSFSRGAKSLEEFTKLFPFGFEGRMPAGKRRKGAALLRCARAHEEKAIQHLRKVA